MIRILGDVGVAYGELEQKWTTKCVSQRPAHATLSNAPRSPRCRHRLTHLRLPHRDAVAVIKEYAPDVLLLDHYIPPKTGLAVLEALNAAVADGSVARPRYIIAMSSVQRCNSAMMAAGADAGFIKWDVPLWAGWARRTDRGQPPSE